MGRFGCVPQGTDDLRGADRIGRVTARVYGAQPVSFA